MHKLLSTPWFGVYRPRHGFNGNAERSESVPIRVRTRRSASRTRVFARPTERVEPLPTSGGLKFRRAQSQWDAYANLVRRMHRIRRADQGAARRSAGTPAAAAPPTRYDARRAAVIPAEAIPGSISC